jgi:16S rRNA (uracil1498-N3)-methyltransferase
VGNDIVAGLPRFYAPDLDASESTVTLTDDERHHLTHVLRLGRGARALVFDGRGAQVLAEVQAIGKTEVELRVLEPAAAAPELPVAFTVAQAVLKGDKMDAVVRDATMMGVSTIQPVVSARTVVPAKSIVREGASAAARWRRVAVASAKQCGRAVVPAIAAPKGLDAVLSAVDTCRLILVEPSASSSEDPMGPPAEAPQSAVLLVGPEGGWTPDEVRAARERGWRSWSLGPMTLRADAAALVALSVLSHVWRCGIVRRG